MTEIRHLTGWLRSLAGFAAVAGALALSGCGGGSGAPNNFFQSNMTVVPATAVAYTGVPQALTISGGTGPFRVTSSNSAVLPVQTDAAGRTVVLLANNVAADTPVNITVQDLGPLTPVAPSFTVPVTVRAAPLLNSFTITPNLADCGTAVCSGQTATASVVVRGPEGGLLAGRPVRFDVIGSSYAIVTNNPAQPLTNSLTVLSDSTGTASVIVKATTNAPTQVAQMSVTDISSGQQLVGNFTILQVTDGTKVLSVVPNTAEIKGAFKGVCSNGFAVDYYVYGGTPPYRISASFPNSVTLVNSVVNSNGGFFRAITNGACVDPLIFSIVDATGRQTTAELHNIEGEGDAPTPAALAVTPTSISDPTSCTGKTYTFLVSGGTPSYGAVVNPSGTVVVTGSQVKVSNVTPPGATVSIFDQSSPQKSVTATVACTP